MNQENVPKPKRRVKPMIVVIIVAAVAILAVGGYLIYDNYYGPNKGLLVNKNSKTSTKVASQLDGTKVDADRATRHPLAIMVENHSAARPQSGLDKASIVYEAITEGGITRFMAVYGPNDADKVGPVRSARTYFVDWAQEFKAYYSHVGGNLDALDKIKQIGVLDLDQFGVGDAAYWREPQAGKAIEHTMYTSTSKLYDQANKKGWSQTGDFTTLKFTTSLEAAKLDLGQKITINFSAPQYLVSWSFDKSTNSYARSLAGQPHLDAQTKEQLKSSTVIIQQMNRWEAPTAIGENGWAMQTTGSDQVKIFSQGKETDGTWKKTDTNSRTLFYDSQGSEIKFIPGHFWIEIVPPDVFSTIKVESLNPATTTAQ